jgi:ATP/ADP translocase
VSDKLSDADAATRAAMLCAAAMVAQQVGLKATRDALFLSSFSVVSLPTMVVVSALVSIAFVLLASRAMAAVSPSRLVSASFVASGLVLLAVAWLARATPRTASVALYLHAGTFGSVLISGFWLLVSERFDPRAGKARIGRIAGAGTLGGLLGGLLAERVAALAGVVSLIPLLSVLHFLCALTVRGLGTQTAARSSQPAPLPTEPLLAAPTAPPLRLITRDPYLRAIAAFVLLGSVAGTLTDYIFKTQAVAAFPDGAQLLRFFAVFYTGTGLLALLVQVGLGRAILERLGLARTAGTLPLAVAAGAVGSLVAPGLASAGGLRAAESTLRGSLYRLGYELLYAPLAPERKRVAKGFVDVALDRMGDALGGGLVRAVLLVVPGAALTALSGLVLALGLLGVWVARGLNRGYVAALEESLLSKASPSAVAVPGLGAVDAMDTGLFLLSVASTPIVAEVGQAEGERQTERPERLDALVSRTEDLRSGDATRVRRGLDPAKPLDPLLAPHVIGLLAWDEVSQDAARALRAIAPRIVGQLVDALLEPDQEFAVRRRIPRALAGSASRRAVEGLLEGLKDRRFEVRFECSRALARLRDEDPNLSPRAEQVFAQVVQETVVGRSVWESRVLLERPDEEGSAFVDEVLQDRCSRSLEHVFTLLSLALPREPLRIVFRALHTGDTSLRGTALEYLDSVLSKEVRVVLIPLLEPEGRQPPPPRSREEVFEELLRSHSSIELNLAALRKKAQAGTAG